MADELKTTIPQDLRHLRACLLCSLVKSFEQFEFFGCDNCEEYLGMKNNREMVYDCTSNNFDGKCIGIYAISVSGRLPPGIVRELKNRGVIYRSRDRSSNI
ncbi:transcription elongation factor SPT4-like protein [Sarcoptes scabiei]|uniref:Transcription elongation factor SPT4-like protein n=1 Tax=Sarcoptes scabiei TaxID=52283 RepID=A0A132A7L4_SARSC|nr:transcription elongation factor SPT4-like protein [Sarcoptes scabiei]